MKQSLTIPIRKPGESEESFYKRVEQWATSDDVRSKADNREWTGSLPFHLDRPADDTGSQ